MSKGDGGGGGIGPALKSSNDRVLKPGLTLHLSSVLPAK